MKFKVVLYEHDDGVAVFCPGLQGRGSQFGLLKKRDSGSHVKANT